MRSRALARLALTVAASTTLLIGAACSSETTPSVPTNLPNAGAIAEGLQGQLGSLATGSGALSALGQLGEQNGAAEQVKSLAAKLVSDSQGLTGKLQQAASAAGVTLPNPSSPESQQTLDELKQKSAADFDQAWLQEVQTTAQETQSAAEGLATTQGLPPQVAEVAQGAADQLAARQEQAKQAAAALGGADGQQGEAAGGQAGTAPGGEGAPGSGTSGTDAGSVAAPEAGKPYTVQRGDTLSSIAQRAYGNPRDEQRIAEANNIADHDVIYPGQVINLP